MPDIRVLIVDDHAILRDGIRSLLERREGIIVVGEAGNGEEALERVHQLLPDLVLMDIAMPVMDGLEATRHIKQAYPDIKILILTQHDSQEFVGPLLQAGAAGYVLKRAGGREVVTAIRQVFEEGAFLQPDVARRVVDYARSSEKNNQEAPHLTEREQEVLKLTIEGKSSKEIASLLVISPKTVSVHRSNIMAKLGVRSSIELVRYALEHKLININNIKFSDFNRGEF
ncbi:MAG: response regulator transcription factor [Chloroflexota bacterium]